MTQRKSSEPLVKVTMNFFAADYTWLRDQFPTEGPQVAIREIIRGFRQRAIAKAAAAWEPTIDELELELSED